MKNLVPYQIFFPIGVLNAILAVGVWFVQNLGWFSSPAMFIHSKLIIGGFLWSFIVGFLMTAVPRMTGTSSANRIEYVIASLLIGALTFFSWNIDGRFFYGASMALIVFMFVYGGRRILRMTKPMPVFFSHVGMAMVLALVGASYHFQGDSYMGIHLYHVGTVLLLVLGIGTRFFSFLSGLPSAFEATNSHFKRMMFHGLGVSMGILLFLCGKGMSVGYLGLAAASLVYLFFVWQVQRRSDRPSALKYGVRIVAAMIPLSFFMTWIYPALYVTWFHLLFIGCFGMITFSVATRVTLAHGSYPVDMEMKSPALWLLVSFLSLGVISRIMYGFSEGLWKTSYLHLAATFWILAVASWSWSFFIRIFRPGPEAKPSC